MRFLVTSTPKFQIPPQLAPTMITAMEEWVKRHTADKKLEQTWGFARGGGGGILNVASHEELSEILTQIPFMPFSDMHVEPLVPIEVGLKNLRQAAARMSQPAQVA